MGLWNFAKDFLFGRDKIENVFEDVKSLKFEEVIKWFKETDKRNGERNNTEFFHDLIKEQINTLPNVNRIHLDQVPGYLYAQHNLISYLVYLRGMNQTWYSEVMKSYRPNLFRLENQAFPISREVFLRHAKEEFFETFREKILETRRFFQQHVLKEAKGTSFWEDHFKLFFRTETLLQCMRKELDREQLKTFISTCLDHITKESDLDLLTKCLMEWKELFTSSEEKEEVINCFLKISMERHDKPFITHNPDTLRVLIVEMDFLRTGEHLDWKCFGSFLRRFQITYTPHSMKTAIEINNKIIESNCSHRIESMELEDKIVKLLFEKIGKDHTIKLARECLTAMGHRGLIKIHSLIIDNPQLITIHHIKALENISEFYRSDKAREEELCDLLVSLMRRDQFASEHAMACFELSIDRFPKEKKHILFELLCRKQKFMDILKNVVFLPKHLDLSDSIDHLDHNVIVEAYLRDKSLSVLPRDLNVYCLKELFIEIPALYHRMCEMLTTYYRITTIDKLYDPFDFTVFLTKANGNICLPVICVASVGVDFIATLLENRPNEILRRNDLPKWKQMKQFCEIDVATHLQKRPSIESSEGVTSLRNEYQRIGDFFEKIGFQIKNTEKYSKFEVNLALDYMDFFNLFVSEKLDVKTLNAKLEELNESAKLVKAFSTAYKWLSELYSLGGVPIIDDWRVEDMNAEDLKSKLAPLNDLGLEWDKLMEIAKFVAIDSPLYESVIKKILKPKEVKQKALDPKELIEVIDKTNDFFTKLINGTLALNHPLFITISEIIMKDGHNIQIELQKIPKIIRVEGGEIASISSVEDAMKLIRFLERRTQMIQYLDDKDLQFEEPYIPGLEGQTLDELRENGKILFSDSGRFLKNLEEAYKARDCHLEYFALASEVDDLVEYFMLTFTSDADFNQKTDALNSNTQLDDFEMNLLATTESTYETFKPLLRRQREQNVFQIDDLLEEIAGLLTNNEEVINNKFSVARDALQNIDDIRSKYSQIQSSLDGILPQIEDVLRQSTFISTISIDGKGNWEVEQTRREGKEESEPNRRRIADVLQDLANGCIFLNVSNATDEQKNQLELFKSTMKLMKELFSLHQTLSEVGHPSFIKPTNELRVDFVMDELPYILETKVVELKKDLSEWNQTILEFTSLPRLQLLRPMQLARLLNRASQQEHQPEVLRAIAFCCFPERVSFEVDVDIFLSNFKPQNPNEPRKELLSSWLDTMASLLTDEELEEKKTVPSLLVAAELNRDYLFRLVMSNLLIGDGNRLHPSLVLFCEDEKLTEEELSRFLKSVETFPHLPFCLVGIDFLSCSLRECLQTWIHEIFSGNRQEEIGQLVMILKNPGSAGSEYFTGIQSEEGPSLDDLSRQTKFKLDYRITSSNLVIGKPCSGKSTFIRQQLKKSQDTAQKTISIKEVLDLVSINEFIANSDKNNIELHLAVSCYTNWDIFSRFIVNLLLNGFIVVFSNSLVYSIPSTKKIKIYLELNGPSPDDKTLSHLDAESNEFLNAAVPLVKSQSQTLNHTKCPQICSPKESNSILFYCKQTGIDQERFVGSIDSKFNCRMEPIQLSRFIQLLTPRMEWFGHYLTMVAIYQQRDPTWEKTLFDFLVEEAYTLSRSDIGELMSSERPPLLSCRTLNVVQDPHAPSGSFTTAVISFFNWGTRLTECKNIDEASIFLHKRMFDSHLSSILSQLRSMVGSVFGIDQSISKAISDANYVLTPDFAMRLILLHERMIANRSLILDGGTGVGKTQTLSMFSDLLAIAQSSSDVLQSINIKLSKEMNVNPHPIPLQSDTIEMFVTTSMGKNPEVVISVLREIANEQLSKFKTIKKTPILARLSVNPNAELDEEGARALLGELLNLRFSSLFHRKLMHQHLSTIDLKRFLNKVFTIAKEVSPLKVVVFIDEVNTGTEVMGLIKEVFVDRTLDGDATAIPENVFFVAAENPHSEEEANYINYNGLEERVCTKPFIVRKTNLSMMKQVISFSHFCKDHEDIFLDIYFDRANNDYIQEESDYEQVKRFILMGQDFLRSAHEGDAKLLSEWSSRYLEIAVDENIKDPIEIVKKLKNNGYPLNRASKINLSSIKSIKEQLRIHASIRDIMRFIKLYDYFRSSRDVLEILNPDNSFPSAQLNHYWHWAALIMSTAMTYYTRIDPNNHIFHKGIFEMAVNRMLNREKCPLLFESKREKIDQKAPFDSYFKHIVRSYCTKLLIPDGVALTEELTQNVFFILVCCQTKIPFQIVGPPGCSKTLSMAIALQNSRGKPFTPLMETRYQCNPNSTDLEIKNVFKRAENRQGKNQFKRSVVFFDEGGLPREEEAALKVIHKPLDNPKVSCIILTNNVLDAAKSNRTLLLLHPTLYAQDTRENEGETSNSMGQEERRRRLSQLIQGVLYNQKDSSVHLNQKQLGIVEAIANCFMRVNDYSAVTKKNLFNQRDFVYFLRSLKKRSLREGSRTLEISPDNLLRSLQRNFGGIPNDQFNQLARSFFIELDLPHPQSIDKDGTILCIQEALCTDSKDAQEDPNVSDFRFVMVIDPTDNESAVNLMKELDLVEEVIRVGRFSQDRTAASMGNVLASMKVAITQGKRVLLVNSSELDACFYDVLNRYFKVITNAQTGERQLLAQVGIGSHSCACVVHPDFRVIVHVPRSNLGSVPLPYLNRFEKYLLTFDQAIDNYVSTHLPSQKRIFDCLTREVLNFSEKMHSGRDNRFLFGCVPGQTELSLILQVAKRTKLEGTLTVPSAFPRKEDKLEGEYLEEQELQLKARWVNFHLLQLASPASVFLATSLPRAYAKDYMLNQEHFNIISFIRTRCKPKKQPNIHAMNKWIIYTRSTSTLTVKTSTNLIMQALRRNRESFDARLILLHTFKSDIECIEHLESNIQARLLVIIADMRNCTQSQVTLARDFCAEKMDKSAVVSIIVCFPPEMAMNSSPVYDAIFTEHFDCIFIDDVGLKSLEENEKREEEEVLIEADPKFWIAKAFGLSEVEIDSKSIENGFLTSFNEAVEQAVMHCSRQVPNVRFRKNAEKSRVFYRSNLKERNEIIQNLLAAHPLWVSQALDSFKHIWSNATVHELISEISKGILAGTLAGSILSVVRSSFRWFFYQSAAPLVDLIFSYGSYDAFSTIERESEEEKLVGLMIRALVAKKIHIRSDISVKSQPPIYFGQCEFNRPSSAVCFSSLSSKIENALRSILNANNRTYHSTRRSLEKLIRSKEPELWNVIEYLDSSKKLKEEYEREFMTRFFLKQDIQDLNWISLMMDAVDCISFTKEDHSILKYHIIHFYFGNELRFFHNALSPLQGSSIEDVKKRWTPPDIAEETSVKKIQEFGLNLISNELWERLNSLEGWTEEEISKWCKIYHELKCRIPFDQMFEFMTSNRDRSQLCVIQAMYLYFSILAPTTNNLNTRKHLNSIDWSIKFEENFAEILFGIYELLECENEAKHFGMGMGIDGERVPYHMSLELLSEEFLNVFLPVLPSSVSLLMKWISGSVGERRVGLSTNKMLMIVRREMKRNFEEIKRVGNEILNGMDPKIFLPNFNMENLQSETIKRLQKNHPDVFLPRKTKSNLVKVLIEGLESCYSEMADKQLMEAWNELKDKTSVFEELQKSALISTCIKKHARESNANQMDSLSQFVKEIMEEKGINGEIWSLFYLSILSDQSLLQLTKSKTLFGWNGADVQVPHLAIFPFQYDEKDPDFPMWTNISQIVAEEDDAEKLKNLMDSIQPNTRDLNVMKTMLLLASYERFKTGRETKSVLSNLAHFQQRFQVNESELKSFRFIASIPMKHDPRLDQFTRYFTYSEEKTLENQRIEIPQLFLHCLAVAIGSPNSHLYILVFDPKSTFSKPVPGSGYGGRKFIDCGFKDDDSNRLMVVTGNKPFEKWIYRYSYCSLVWMSVGWQLLLDPPIFPHYKEQHFLNYTAEDGKLFAQPNEPNHITQESLVKHSVLLRALDLKEGIHQFPEVEAYGINVPHFLTLTLHGIWSLANSNQVQMRPTFNFEADVIEYENMITQRVFEPVLENYVNQKKFLVTVITKSKDLEALLDFRSKQMVRTQDSSVGFLSFLECSEWTAKKFPLLEDHEKQVKKTERQKRKEDNTSMALPRFFSENLPSIAASRYLSSIADFFAKFNRTFSYRLSREDCSSLSVPECIQKLIESGADPEEIKTFEKTWNRVKEDWKKASTQIGSFGAACNNQNQIEVEQLKTAVLDDFTLVVNIIHDTDNPSIIVRLFDLWMDYLQSSGQSQMKRGEERLNYVMKTVQSTSTGRCEALTDLSNNSSSNFMLIGCPATVEDLTEAFVFQFTRGENGEIQFEEEKAHHIFLERYLAGRSAEIDSNQDHISFKFQSLREATDAQIASAKQFDWLSDLSTEKSTIPFVISNFWNLVQKIEKIAEFNEPSKIQNNIPLLVEGKNEKDLKSFIETLERIICSILTAKDKNSLLLSSFREKSLGWFVKEILHVDHLPQLFQKEVIYNVHLKHIGPLCASVLDYFLEGNHLYLKSNVQGSSKTFGSSQKNHFQKLRKRIQHMSSEGQKSWYFGLQHLLGLLNGVEATKAISKKPDEELSKLFDTEIKAIVGNVITQQSRWGKPPSDGESFNVAVLFDEKPNGRAYVPFMKMIHRTCAELQMRMQKELEFGSREVYKELSFGAVDVQLEDSDKVKQPTHEPEEKQEEATKEEESLTENSAENEAANEPNEEASPVPNGKEEIDPPSPQVVKKLSSSQVNSPNLSNSSNNQDDGEDVDVMMMTAITDAEDKGIIDASTSEQLLEIITDSKWISAAYLALGSKLLKSNYNFDQFIAQSLMYHSFFNLIEIEKDLTEEETSKIKSLFECGDYEKVIKVYQSMSNKRNILIRQLKNLCKK
eukprot:TRINITY_DN1723_c0_g2_i3.p1 TRINITY_DN1723_c0_g2~~TRINITY_DN1723_c0_g2_i3.p1  ORF type:complete len:4843 (+),score=1626.58 TRINITY_DN1723_c0_g2_i3:91-14619(+)